MKLSITYGIKCATMKLSITYGIQQVNCTHKKTDLTK